MNRSRATTTLVAIITTIGCSLEWSSAQEQPSPTANWVQTVVRGCQATGWTQCVGEKMARTFRLLDDLNELQISEGVRLVKTAKTSKRNETSDVIDKMVSFINSHSLQIDLWTPNKNVTDEGRRRHAYRKVFPIIVGTYMIMSAVLIPLGFMFMSTLGGKALLISKMALMVSLMSNIKKMFSYEYYVPPAPPTSHHHWKRTLLAHRTTAGPLYSSYTTY